MSITTGIGTAGKGVPVLRLTLSQDDLAAFRLRWATTRLSWRAERVGHNWRLTFTSAAKGPQGMIKNLRVGDAGEREYLTWSWSGTKNPLFRQLPRLGKVTSSHWNAQGELVVEISGDPVALPPLPALKRPHPAPAPVKRSSDSAAARLAALKTTLNHAIRELKSLGLPVRVTQAQAGGDVDMLIKF